MRPYTLSPGRYGFGVDVWGAGCVLAELLLLNPIFPGTSDIDQLFRVLLVLGTPTSERWPGARQLPDFDKIAFPPSAPAPWEQVLPGASPAAHALAQSLLALDPRRRPSAAAALAGDPFFTTPPGPAPLAELCPAEPPAAGLEPPVPLRGDGTMRSRRKVLGPEFLEVSAAALGL